MHRDLVDRGSNQFQSTITCPLLIPTLDGPGSRAEWNLRTAVFAAHEVERAVVTFWDDLQCVEAFNNSDTYAETVAAIESAGFLRGRSSVEVFDVEEQFFVL